MSSSIPLDVRAKGKMLQWFHLPVMAKLTWDISAFSGISQTGNIPYPLPISVKFKSHMI